MKPSYSSIFDAYIQATHNDIIYVGKGRYDEEIKIEKRISLIGAGPQNSFITRTINVRMKDVTILGFTISSSNGDGINVYLPCDIRGVCTIKNCIITSCTGSGIETGYACGAQTLIQNNVIIYNNQYGIDNGDSRPTIYKNIILYNKKIAIKNIDSQINNASFNNVYKNSMENESLDYYELSLGDISADPLFIDVDSGNFALQDSSPCKDSGLQGFLYNDPDGTRNDMGAYGGTDSEAFWPYNDTNDCFTQEDIEEAIAEKVEIINQKNQIIDSMFTLEEKNQAVSIAVASKDEIIKLKDQIIASMFTFEEKEEAVLSAEASKDEIIKLKDQIIASMITLEEKEEAIQEALSEKDQQCQNLIHNENLIVRNKWDINMDNKKDLFEAIDALKVCSEASVNE